MKRFTFNSLNLLAILRQRLESVEIHSQKTAQRLCNLIPASCPFERTIQFFDRPLIHIPPLCKLNPLYDQLVELRFKALVYLADQTEPGSAPSCYSS